MNNLRLEVLSPLHIGDNDNKKLSSLSDFIEEKNHIKLIDHKKLEKLFSENPRIMDDYIKEIKSFKGKTYSLRPFLRKYKISEDEVISGEIIPIIGDFSGKEISPFISENGKSYIPASSIKGAIRNSFAYHFLRNNKHLIGNLTRNYNFRNNEKEIFGKSANNDLFRFLQIADTSAFGKDSTSIYAASIYHTAKLETGSDINYQCINKENETHFRIKFKKIPNQFYDKNESLSFWKNKFSFDNLFRIINEFSLRFIEREINEIKYVTTLKKSVSFLSNLKKEIEESNNKVAFFCLGKGTTIMGKTILLLLQDYELGTLRNNMEDSRSSGNFGWKYVKNLRKNILSKKLPITRLVYEENGLLNANFGWVKIEEIE